MDDGEFAQVLMGLPRVTARRPGPRRRAVQSGPTVPWPSSTSRRPASDIGGCQHVRGRWPSGGFACCPARCRDHRAGRPQPERASDRAGVLADVTGAATLIWPSRRAAPARPVTSRGGPRRDRDDPRPGHRQRDSEWLGMPGNSAPVEVFTVDVTTGNARAGIPIRNCAYRLGRTGRPTARLGSRGR